jgi:hypothetical protein
MTEYLPLIGLLAFAWLCRTAYYRQVFGRWYWGRLPEDKARRLLPRDSSLAYKRGWREGQHELMDRLVDAGYMAPVTRESLLTCDRLPTDP